MDTSNADARRALADMLTRFPAWRDDLCRFQAHVERRSTEAERQHIMNRCAEIEGEVMASRTELIMLFADAPPRLAGNSRVVDMERALDNIDVMLRNVRRALVNG
jgi:hypothetical protein